MGASISGRAQVGRPISGIFRYPERRGAGMAVDGGRCTFVDDREPT
jgi:hypothetical protein